MTREEVLDEELLIKKKQLIDATSYLYEALGVICKLTKGMRHIADNHPTMNAHKEIMMNLRLAEDYEEKLGNILSQGNFGRDEIEEENRQLKDEVEDLRAYCNQIGKIKTEVMKAFKYVVAK